MAKFTRLLVAACVAVVALALFSGMAAALRSIQISNPGAQRGTGARVSFEDESGFLRTICNLTLNGSGNERISKTLGSTIGTITEGRTESCSAFGGAATVTVNAEASRPFTARYNGFEGTLPSITGIRVLTEGVSFTINEAGRRCTYAGRAANRIPVSRGTEERTEFLTEVKDELQAGSSEGCPQRGTLRGSVTAERSRTVTLV